MSLTITGCCPKCGGEMRTRCTDGPEYTKTICIHCGYENPTLDSVTYTTSGTGVAYGNLNWNPYEHITIQTKDLKLLQTDLGLTIDVPFSVLSKIETIEINGIKFNKEDY